MINATVEVSNSGGTTPNFTAAISDLGTFLESVRSQLQPAVYTYVCIEDAEPLTPSGIGITWKWRPDLPKGITLTIVDDTEEMLAVGDTITVTIAADEVNVTEIQKRTPEMYDAVADGVMYRGIPFRTGFVADEDELEKFENEHPGFIAIQYGFVHMWQLDDSGEWVVIGGEEGSGS